MGTWNPGEQVVEVSVTKVNEKNENIFCCISFAKSNSWSYRSKLSRGLG